ncbi:MAG: TolC family protein [Archangium sp.]|nr:TolC family protein [Archangium sp.]MDP3152228.1 TolC family protein [Archangium sp.]MDP3571073.1 TolC family protein [Archangium sp.]
MWSVLMVSSLLAAPLELSSLGEDAALQALLWQQSAALQPARARVAQAEAERRKALRLPNPGLDLSVNTLPVGPLNPPELKDPFLNVPNVAVGLSVLLELGKREPRQDATSHAARAAALEALEQLRQKQLELEDVVGDVAAEQLRVDALEGLALTGARLTELQQARVEKGDTSELDADRARLEYESTSTALGEARAQLADRLRQCAELVATPCIAFSKVEQATRWLDRHGGPVAAGLERRPDLRALEATAAAARASQRLAQNGWIPDPTVRVGYVRDQFVASGNQQNSLYLGVTFPLPLFERGADDAAAAALAAAAADRQREQLLSTARAQLEQVGAQLVAVETRQRRLREHSLPLAQSVVERLNTAVNRGAAPLQELLLARRSLAELLLTATELDRTDFHLHVARARLTSTLDAPLAPLKDLP